MYNKKISAWGRVITIAALLSLVFYLGYEANKTFNAQQLKTAHAAKQMDF